MPKATMLAPVDGPGPAAQHVEQFAEVLQSVARSITQVRLHERLLRAAGVRVDRSGVVLLHKLAVEGDSLRVTDLSEMLGVDTPAVTRKVQQLEREGLVARRSDPEDRRASRLRITPAGRRIVERVWKARQVWLEQLLEGWTDDDLRTLGALLGRFGKDLERDLEDARV